MNRLSEIIANITKEKVYIQTHNFPDPDAISSAFGLQYLLKIKGIEATICYKGKIDRENTRKMMELFQIEAKNIDEMGQSLSGCEIILIDAQKKSGNTYDIDVEEVMSIDHHPVYQDYEYIYSDIRADVGACASIIASYYDEAEIEIPENVATALLYGIKIDTAQLTRNVSKLDLDMFYKLFFKVNKQHIAFLESNSVQLEDLKAYGNAIDTIVVEEHVSFANTGKDCPEALIAAIADFMVELKEVYFSVVYSIRSDGIKISVRSERGSMCHAGEMIIEALEGIGTGGGHSTMAAGFVSEYVYESTEEIVKEIKRRLKETALKQMENAVKEYLV